jgi:hypothetical protein
MHVARMLFAPLTITWESAHVNQELLEIRFSVALKFNTAAEITNVQLEPNATMESAVPSAQLQEIASVTSCVFKTFVNPPARVTQLAQISNSVKTTGAFWSQSVSQMKIAKLTNIAQLIRTEDLNANKFAVEDSCVDAIQTAWLEIMLLNVNASQDFMLMEKFAERLNANQITTVAMINAVKITCARLFV